GHRRVPGPETPNLGGILAVLHVQHLAVFYGDVQALWDVSLQVKEGEIVTLLGANGAGKTTTLHTISGLLRPRQGSVMFQGQALHRESPQGIVEAGLIHIAEGRELFPHMTVLENLELGAFSRRARRLRWQSLAYVMDHVRTVRTGTDAELLADDAIQAAYLGL